MFHLFLIIYWITKGRGIGGGDIKLMAAAGLLLGWQNILLSLMIGSIAGSVIHLALMKIQGKDRVLAFGPYLAFFSNVTSCMRGLTSGMHSTKPSYLASFHIAAMLMEAYTVFIVCWAASLSDS